MKKILKRTLAVLSAVTLACSAGTMAVFAEDETLVLDAESQAYLDSLTDPDDIRIAKGSFNCGLSLIEAKLLVDLGNGIVNEPVYELYKTVESTDPYYGETDNGIIYQFENGTLTFSKDEDFYITKSYPALDYTEVNEPWSTQYDLAYAWQTIGGTNNDSTDKTYPWDSYANEIQHIVFEDEFDTLGEGEFYNCVNLESFDYSLAELWTTSLPSQIKRIDLKEGAKVNVVVDDAWRDILFAADVVFTGAGRSAATGCQVVATTTANAANSNASSTATTSGVLYGDADLDGKVRLQDAILIGRVANGSITINDAQRQNMDCNADGVVDGRDATTLLRFLVGYVDSLPEVSDAE